MILASHSPMSYHSFTSQKNLGKELGYSRLMITILIHLRTEICQSSVHILGVPYETQNKVRHPSKAIMDTHLPGLIKMWSGCNTEECAPQLLQGLLVLWFSNTCSAWLWLRRLLIFLAFPGLCWPWREIVTVSLIFENSSLDGIPYLSNHSGNWVFSILN